MILPIIAALLGTVARTPSAPAPATTETFRVLVSTDLGGDPDDVQSLYRLVHYSDILKVEGIVSSPGPGAKNAASKIKEWIRRVDVEHLRRQGHPQLMTEDSLLQAVKQGAVDPGPPAAGRATEGSRWIVSRARAPDPENRKRPLWVLVWGSLTDVAQALHDDPSIAPGIRIYFIGSNNTRADVASRDYVFNGMASGRWPKLWWIENGIQPVRSHDTFRGVYEGGDQAGDWNSAEFVKRHIRGHGSNHNGEYKEISGDAFPLAGPGVPGGTILKEGDSPSMLYLLYPVIGGVGNVDHPTRESWGGRFRHADEARYPNYYIDLDLPAEQCRETISKWRAAFLSDWGRRWDWYQRPQRLNPPE
ncbi:MAG: DUF1593 domain-containing protein [Acidobacteria bacterium]|nr:DUF1593 domain-containing protein [Acidobacteriota bacterium]